MEGHFAEEMDILDYDSQSMGQDGASYDVAMDSVSHFAYLSRHSADRNDHQVVVIDDGSFDPSVVNDAMSETASSQDFPMDEEEESKEPLSYELQIGYRILKEIMSDSNKSVNWPFMDPVDTENTELWDYNERIQKPMWLKKVEQTFHQREYNTITEFVSDVRLMLENCYRYNGPDHYISKRGQKLEMILEQKLALLSRELREKTSIAATSGQPIEEKVISGTRRRKVLVPHDSTALLNQLRMEEKEREKEQRRVQMVEKQKEREAYLAELQEWEDSLYPTPWKKHLNAMWEVPQIGHFLFLCSLQLNIGEIVHWELERGFLLPRESCTFQTVMTSLISTPYQRTRLDKKPLMPYKVWEERVRIRIRQWYKVLNDFKGDRARAAYKLGIDDKFFKIVGLRSPLEKKKFHELSFYQRIWIVKSLCNWCLENQEVIREAIEANVIEDQRTYSLGFDADGFEYIHFPQFCGADLRIYKQAPFKMPKSEAPPPADSSPKKQKPRAPKKPPRERDGRLRQNPRTSRSAAANNDSSEDSSGASDDSGISGSESEEDPEPKVPRYNRAAVTRNKLLDLESDVSREGTPTRMTRSRVSNASSKTPSRESTPQRSRRSRRSEASSTPEPSLYQRRSLRRLGIDANEIANIYFPDALESSASKSPSQNADDDEDRESTASDVKRPASRQSQGRKRKGRSRTRSRKSTAKRADSPKEDEQDKSMDVSEDKDKTEDDLEISPEKPFSSYSTSATNVKTSDEPNDKGHSGKASPSNCDIKSVRSECPSDPTIFADSECSNSVRSTPVKEMVNTAETDKDETEKSAIIDDQCVTDDGETAEKHSQVVKNDKQTHSAYSKSISDKPNDLRNNACDGTQNCDDKDAGKTDPKMDPLKTENDDLSKVKSESSFDNSLVMSEKGTESQSAEPFPFAMGDGASIKTEDIKVEALSESGDQVKGETSGVKDEDRVTGKPEVDASEIKVEGVKKENTENCDKSVEEDIMPEITEPVIGEFELIVESVDDLRNLVLKFAPPEPVTEVKGTREKVIKPIPRKKCEVDLHKRLQFLMEELEPWEQKLIAANKRARLKMRREHANYKEDPEPEIENVWESEESDSEDSNSEDEDGTAGDKKDEKEKRKIPAAAVAAVSVAEYVKPPTPDLEISSRGRIRKRRIIPDAAEEEGSEGGSPMNQGRNAKRQKKDNASPVPTTSQEIPVTTSVPSHSTIQSVINQLAATNQLPSNGISVLNINNQMVLVSPGQKPVIIQTSQPLNNLSMSNLNLLAQLTGLVKPAAVSGANMNGQTSSSGVATVSQSPIRATASANILRQASPKPAGSQSLISSIKPGQLTAQQVLMMKKQQQQQMGAPSTVTLLSKPDVKSPTNSESSISTTRVVTVLPTGTPKTVAITDTTGKSIVSASAAASTKPQYVAYNNLHQMAPQVVKQLIQAQMKVGAVKSVVVAKGQSANGTSREKVVQVLSPGSSNIVDTMSASQKASLQGQLISKLSSTSAAVTPVLAQSITQSQSAEQMQQQSLSVSPRSNNNALKQSNPGLLRALSSPPKPKYAGNVTVKTLLESRAAQMKSDTNTPLANVPSASNPMQVSDLEMTGLFSEAKTREPLLITLDQEQETRLDEAIKTVLTEIQTSLPTATLKVTSPFMGSKVKNNRSITVPTPAMRAPIPALPQIISRSSSSVGSKTNIASIDSASSVIEGRNTGTIVMKPSQIQGAGQKLVLPVQLKPQSQALMGLTSRSLGRAAEFSSPLPAVVSAADVCNVQAVVSNTALLQKQLNAATAAAASMQGVVGVSNPNASAVPAPVLHAAAPLMPSASAKQQQAISQVVTSPVKTSLKIHSISVQGSSATLQLTGVHGVASGKAVQLKLTIPPGLTIHQLLQSPQLQQHLANLQTSGLSAATKTLAVRRTVAAAQNSAVPSQGLTQQSSMDSVPQQPTISPKTQVLLQAGQTQTIASAAPIPSHQEKAVLQLSAGQSGNTVQIVPSQGNVRGILLKKHPAQSAKPAAVIQSGTTMTASGVSPSTIMQVKPQNIARLIGDNIRASKVAVQHQQGGIQAQVVKTTSQLAQKQLMQVGYEEQDVQTVSAQRVVTQTSAGFPQSVTPVQNFAQVGLQAKNSKQIVQKSPSTIKHITQTQSQKSVNQSPQKAQVISSTKSQTVQQLLEAAQRRAANQGTSSVWSSGAMSAGLAQSLTGQQLASVQTTTQSTPKATITSPQQQATLTSPNKLVLVNVNGQLMTPAGMPVTVSQGMLKVIPGTQSVAGSSSGIVQLPAAAATQIPTHQPVIALAPHQQQPQQQFLMLPQQALSSPVKVVTNQVATSSLTAQQLLAVQQAQVQQQLKQAQVQISPVQAGAVQAAAQMQLQSQSAQLPQENIIQTTAQSLPVTGLKAGGIAGTLVTQTQAQSTITLSGSAVSQTSGVAHIRMPVGTMIVPPKQTSRPAAASPTNITAVRLADGRYVLQVPAGVTGTSKLVLPSSSTSAYLPNGDSL